MNPRERILALILVVLLVGAGGAFAFIQMYEKPLADLEKRIASENEEILKKKALLSQAVSGQYTLKRWMDLSLPSDPALAKREYTNFLRKTLTRSGFTSTAFTITPRNADDRSAPTMGAKKPIFTRLQFIVDGSARPASVVRFLEEFYNTGLLHEIRNISVSRPTTLAPTERAGEVNVKLTIEALIVNGADKRNYLLPNIDSRLVAADAMAALRGGPSGMGLALWAIGPTGPLGPGKLAHPSRNYAAMTAKDVYFGPSPTTPGPAKERDVTQDVFLTDITHGNGIDEACLCNRFLRKDMRVRCAKGYDQFIIRNNLGKVQITGKVVKIRDQDVLFVVDEKFYNIHVGRSVQEALREPLSQQQAEILTKEPLRTSMRD